MENMQNYKLLEFLVILLSSCIVIGFHSWDLVCTLRWICKMSLRWICHVNCNDMTFPPVSVLMSGDNIAAILQILTSGCLIPMGDANTNAWQLNIIVPCVTSYHNGLNNDSLTTV